MAVTSVSASAFLGSWGTSVAGEDHALLQAKAAPPQLRVATRPVRPRPMMGGASSGKGVFAPVVVLTRNIIGKKTFNQLRGKAIALHSQVAQSHILTDQNSVFFADVQLSLSLVCWLKNCIGDNGVLQIDRG